MIQKWELFHATQDFPPNGKLYVFGTLLCIYFSGIVFLAPTYTGMLDLMLKKSPLYHLYFLNLLCYLAIFTFSTDLCRVDGVEEVQYEISRIKQKSK